MLILMSQDLRFSDSSSTLSAPPRPPLSSCPRDSMSSFRNCSSRCQSPSGNISYGSVCVPARSSWGEAASTPLLLFALSDSETLSVERNGCSHFGLLSWQIADLSPQRSLVPGTCRIEGSALEECSSYIHSRFLFFFFVFVMK